jgi:hypothetical protein
MLPAIERIPSNIDVLLSHNSYFVLYTPHQSGKTTSIKALVKKINNENKYYALYCSFKSLDRFLNIETAIPMIAEIIVSSLLDSPVKEFSEAGKRIPTFDSKFHRGLSIVGGKISDDYFITLPNAISLPLQTLCKILDRPLVVFIDEIDTLSGDVLVSCLGQLKIGYAQRSKIPFPGSIALVGLCDIRDYRARVRHDPESLGTSNSLQYHLEGLYPGQFFQGGREDPLWPAHGGDWPGIRGRGCRAGNVLDRWPALAGQRPGP